MIKNKKILFFMIITIAVTFLCNVCFAENWMPGDKPKPVAPSEAEPFVEVTLGTFQWIGYLISIGVIIWIGIRYLVSGAGEKAKAKETLLPFLVGAFMLAAATTITSVLFNL